MREASKRANANVVQRMGMGLLLLFLGFFAAAVFWPLGIVVFVAGAACFAWAAGIAVRNLVQNRAAASTITVVGSVVVSLFAMGFAAFGGVVAYLSSMDFGRGRQLRRFGKILLPPVQAGDTWVTISESAHDASELDIIDAATREALAAQWRENGRTEHASVAAFARLTLDLMTLGAPPALVADAQRDALDEIRHAEMCFSLAARLDGRDASPGAFPQATRARTLPANRTLALSTLAVDSLIDGALHEGVSAAVVAKLAARTAVPHIAAMMREIARDEGRHAKHGWDVTSWCLAEGGAPVLNALQGAVQALPEKLGADMPSDAKSGAWERWGIMSEALEHAEYTRMREHLVARVAKLASQTSRLAA